MGFLGYVAVYISYIYNGYYEGRRREYYQSFNKVSSHYVAHKDLFNWCLPRKLCYDVYFKIADVAVAQKLNKQKFDSTSLLLYGNHRCFSNRSCLYKNKKL